MCIWSVKPEDRHCEFCTYVGECECHSAMKNEHDADWYIACMNQAAGEDVRAKTHRRELVWARYMLTYQMLADGFTIKEICDAIGKDRTTLLYAPDKIRVMFERRWEYPTEMRIWNRFKELIKL